MRTTEKFGKGWGADSAPASSSNRRIWLFIREAQYHGLINYMDIKARCRHLKELTCKKALPPVFIRDYRLEIQAVMLVFSTQFCELLPRPSSLWFNSPPFPSIYTYTVCTGGGGWVSRPQTDKHLPQSPVTFQFFKMTTFSLPFMSLFFVHSIPFPNYVLSDQILYIFEISIK